MIDASPQHFTSKSKLKHIHGNRKLTVTLLERDEVLWKWATRVDKAFLLFLKPKPVSALLSSQHLFDAKL